MADKIIYMVERDDELYHYGVKGMKWGVRRTAEQLGHIVKKGASAIAQKASESREKGRQRRAYTKERSKPISEMTDDELRKRLNRLDMEKKYKDYISSMTPKKEHKVRKLIGEIMSSGVKSISNAGVQKLSNALFKEKDTVTEYDFSSLSKIGDGRLKSAVQRLNLEKQYKNLMNETWVDRGRRYVNSKLDNAPPMLPEPKKK